MQTHYSLKARQPLVKIYIFRAPQGPNPAKFCKRLFCLFMSSLHFHPEHRQQLYRKSEKGKYNTYIILQIPRGFLVWRSFSRRGMNIKYILEVMIR